MWIPGQCDDADVSALLRFGRRVLGGQHRNEERFGEQMLTHLHLCSYRIRVAKYMLLRAWRVLDALDEETLASYVALGHDKRELLLRILQHVHSAPHLRTDAGPSAGPLLPGGNQTTPLAEAARELSREQMLGMDDAATQAALDEYERARAEALLPGVRKWEAALDVAVASPDGLDLPKLKQLVVDGAEAHGTLLQDLLEPAQPGESDVGRLGVVHAQWREASGWHERCAKVVGGAQTGEMLEGLLAEAETFPLPLHEVAELRRRLERVRAWLEATRAAAGQPRKLRELFELHTEAEALRQAGAEAEALAARYQRCKKWMGQANDILRRTSSRGRAAAPKLSVADAQRLLGEAEELQLEQLEIEQVHEKLEEAKVWMEEAAVLLASGQSVGEQAMNQLLDLQARSEAIPILLDNHAELEERLTRLQSWQGRAKAALDGRNPQSLDTELVRELVAEASELGISLGDLAHLSSQLAFHTWSEGAAKALESVATLLKIERLVEQAAELGEVAGLAESVAKLRAKLEAGRAWRERLRELRAPPADGADGGGEPPERLPLKDAVSLLYEADTEGVSMPESDALKAEVARAKEWQEQARKNSSRSTRGGASRPTLDELRALLVEGGELPLLVAEAAMLAQQVGEAEEWQLRAEAAVGVADELSEGAAALKELREVQKLGEVVVADVDVGVTVAVRLWRMQTRVARARPKGGVLKDLQALLDEGEKLQLPTPILGDEPPPPPADEAGGASGDGAAMEVDGEGGAASADGGKAADGKPKAPPRKSGRAKKATRHDDDDEGADGKAGGAEDELVVLRDGERERAERHKGAAEWRDLKALVARALEWQQQAEAVLTTTKVKVEDLERLLASGKELPVVMEERDWLGVNLVEAQKWVQSAQRLQEPTALLEDVQKLLKEYAKVNVLSEQVDALRKRATRGEEWLSECHDLYDKCGIELNSLRMILETDGGELYCACRQPDDLQRLMIGCDHCPLWYHINCMGVSSAKARALGDGAAEFMCPACCEAKGVKFAFTPRVTKPPPKKLPTVPRVASLIGAAEQLSVKVEEALLLRKALLRCRRWQAELVPKILSIFVQSTGAALCGSLRPERLDEWLQQGERYRVECELCVVLKGWRCMLRLRGHGGAAGKLELQWLSSLLEHAKEEGVSVQRLNELLGEEADSAAIAKGAAAASKAAEAAAAAAATAAAAAAAAVASAGPAAAAPAAATNGAASSDEQAPKLEASDDVAMAEATEAAATGGDAVAPKPEVKEEAKDGEAPPEPTKEVKKTTAKADEGEDEDDADEEEEEEEEEVIEEVELDKHAAAWLRAELVALRAELVVLEQRMVEAREWEQHVAQLTSGAAGSEQAALQQLIARGQQSPINLPSLPQLQEHFGRVASWTRECDACLQPAPQAATGPVGAGGGGARASLQKLLQVEADGAKLCMAGPKWQQLLHLLKSASSQLIALRRALVHYEGAPAFTAAFAKFDELRIHCDEGELLRQQLKLMQARHAAQQMQQQQMAQQQMAQQQMAQQQMAQQQQPQPPGTIVGMPPLPGQPPSAPPALVASAANGLLCDEAPPGTGEAAEASRPPSAGPDGSRPESRAGDEGSSSSAPPAAAEERKEKPISTGLHGLTRKQATTARLVVFYEEDGVSVPYQGAVESVDAKRGIRVRLDGFQKREWVTDEDEWEWIDGSYDTDGPSPGFPIEHVVGAAVYRQTLQRLARTSQVCADAAVGKHTPMAHAPAAKKSSKAGGAGTKRAAAAEPKPPKPPKQPKQPAKSAASVQAAGIVAAAAAAAAQAQQAGGGGQQGGGGGQKRKAPMTAAAQPMRAGPGGATMVPMQMPPGMRPTVVSAGAHLPPGAQLPAGAVVMPAGTVIPAGAPGSARPRVVHTQAGVIQMPGLGQVWAGQPGQPGQPMMIQLTPQQLQQHQAALAAAGVPPQQHAAIALQQQQQQQGQPGQPGQPQQVMVVVQPQQAVQQAQQAQQAQQQQMAQAVQKQQQQAAANAAAQAQAAQAQAAAMLQASVAKAAAASAQAKALSQPQSTAPSPPPQPAAVVVAAQAVPAPQPEAPQQPQGGES